MVGIYKLIGDNLLFDILGTVATNRGIKDLDKIIEFSYEDISSPYLLKNMEKAVEMFSEHMKKRGSSIVVLVDSDPDGYTSASMIVKYVRDNFPNMEVRFLLHKGKQHGLTKHIMKELRNNLPDLLIIPDASSGDFDEHKELKSKGVDILVLDHHNVGRESEDAIVVSNHKNISPNENVNRELSGAGVVLKFIEALDEKYGLDESVNYYSLASVGIVADMMEVKNPETSYYVYQGLKNVRNPVIRELLYKNAYHALKEAYPKIVSFNISNYLNAVIRAGTKEDKETVFRGLLGEVEQLHREYTYRGEKREKTEELHHTAYRMANNARSRQNNAKKKSVKEIVELIENNELYKDSMIFVTGVEVREGFGGLIAMDIVKKYRKPVAILFYNEKSDTYSGSVRGYDGIMTDTRSFLQETGLVEYAEGHGNAFGLSVKKDKLGELIEKINSELDGKKTPIEVDFEIGSDELTTDLVEDISSYENHWRKGFDEPLFAVTGVELNCSHFTFKGTMKTTYNGIELMAFQVDDRMEELALAGKSVIVDIVGKMGINRWMGNESPQFIMELIDIKEVIDDPFDDLGF